MVNFDNISDKENLNMMKAKIKIIDLGTATQLTADKNYMTNTAIGTLNNMAPTILKKYNSNDDINKGYDEKCDIWSIGTVCYELLFGKSVFKPNSPKDLEAKINKGIYTLPNTVSKEVVSFLNCMLQYDSKKRLNTEQLLKHPFLTKNVRYFEKINTISNINRSKTISLQERKNLKMNPILEEDVDKSNKIKMINKFNSVEYNNKNISFNYNNNINKEYHKANSSKQIYHNNYNNKFVSFYGQNMLPNGPPPNMNSMPQIGKEVGKSMPLIRTPEQQVINPSFGVGIPNSYSTYFTSQNNMRSKSDKNINYNNYDNNLNGERKDENNCCIQ